MCHCLKKLEPHRKIENIAFKLCSLCTDVVFNFTNIEINIYIIPYVAY